jgi:3'-phosphoadenosine 5'-phosphosulfate sulfotransferase (PAPS reductase)/FAD synthetase
MPAITKTELLQMQSLPLHLKIHKTCARIQEWYDYHDGMIYPAFSGGIDSTVLVDISRRLYPDLPIVFSNTGNELPEIVKFVESFPNVTIIRPKHGLKWVFENYGYPVISKSVSMALSRYATAKDDVQRELRLNGGICPSSGKKQHMGVIPKKYHYLTKAPFKISDKCCDVLKKSPFRTYDRKTGRAPMTAEMAEDSNTREQVYLKTGCNFFGSHHKSTPMGFWTRQDVLAYIKVFNLPYCSVYGDIIYDPVTKTLETTKEQRTGCMFCMFGVHMEKHPNRFERMKVSHPKHYAVCMNIGCGKVMDYIGVEH